MKNKKSILLAAVASLTGFVAIALSGCEWFSFEGRGKSVSGTLGYEGDAGKWMTSTTDVNREESYELSQEAYAAYSQAKATGAIASTVSFLEYLKAANDDSAAIAKGLRSSVAIVAQPNATSSQLAFGSGVIYVMRDSEEEVGGKTAYVVTNYHVAENNGKLCSLFYTYLYGDKYSESKHSSENAMMATYIGGSKKEDIAVLSVEIPKSKVDALVPLALSSEGGLRNSDDAHAGEKVYAIGNTLGNGISVVSGILSVEAEYNAVGENNKMLSMRTDAPVTHGNSGGGLFDRDGKLLGIVNGGMEQYKNGADTIDVDGYGFAIPANRALAVAQSVIDNNAGTGTNGRLGAYYGLFGSISVTGSRGEFDAKTQSINVIETIVFDNFDSKSPFVAPGSGAAAHLKKPLSEIRIADSMGKQKLAQKIVREHQIATIFFTVRSGDRVTLVFDDESKSTVTVAYSNANHFGRAL